MRFGLVHLSGLEQLLIWGCSSSYAQILYSPDSSLVLCNPPYLNSLRGDSREKPVRRGLDSPSASTSGSFWGAAFGVPLGNVLLFPEPRFHLNRNASLPMSVVYALIRPVPTSGGIFRGTNSWQTESDG